MNEKGKKLIYIIITIFLMACFSVVAIYLFPKKIEPLPISPEQSDTDILNKNISTKPWMDNIWLNKVDKDSIKTITFTTQEFLNIKAEKAWEYDGIKFAKNEENIVIYVTPGMKLTGSMSAAFKGMTNLESIVGWENVDTSECTDMSEMFAGCTNLTEIDLSQFQTDGVVTANRMFKGCRQLKELDMSTCNMEKAIDLSEMFSECTSLSKLVFPTTKEAMDMSSMLYAVGTTSETPTVVSGTLNTSHCKNMSNMFNQTYLSDYSMVKDFDTSSLENAESMFERASWYEVVDLTTWNTSNLKTTKRMFYNVPFVFDFNLDGWDASNLIDTEMMFYNCNNAELISLVWKNVKYIQTAKEMFKNCYDVKWIGLQGFNDVKFGNTVEMFCECESLQTIVCSGLTSDISEDMFKYCVSLEGRARFDETKIDASMATPYGYFYYIFE